MTELIDHLLSAPESLYTGRRPVSRVSSLTVRLYATLQNNEEQCMGASRTQSDDGKVLKVYLHESKND